MSIIDQIKKSIVTSEFLNSPFFIKYKAFLVPLIVLIIAVVITLLVIVPQTIQLLDTFKTLGELRDKSLFYKKKEAELKSVNIDQYKKDLDTALIALPVNKDVPGIIGQLLVALSSSGMSLEGVSLSSSPAENEKVEELGIKLETGGSETSLENFLDRIKLSPRIIKLSAIQVSKTSLDKLTASVTLVTFYQLLPKDIGSIDAELPKIAKAETQVLTDIATKAQSLRQTSPEETRSTTGKLDPFAP